jgi:nitroreductase
MDFAKLIVTRESIRTYDPDRSVSRDAVLRILEKSRMAPSAKNIQPWKFIVITTPELLRKVKDCYHREWFRNAPLVLVVVGDKREAYVRSYDTHCFIETDLAIVMTYILLAAADEGVATCWMSNFDPNRLHSVLELSHDEIVLNITPLGYPPANFQPTGQKDRKPLDQLVDWK